MNFLRRIVAYSVDTKRICNYGGCISWGRYEVLSNRNASMGHYCQRHADKRVAELRKEEQNDRSTR